MDDHGFCETCLEQLTLRQIRHSNSMPGCYCEEHCQEKCAVCGELFKQNDGKIFGKVFICNEDAIQFNAEPILKLKRA